MLSVLSLLMGFASISTDLYLPAMPMMALSLHAGAGMVELTISGYLIGFSLGQLLWGPIGDRYGRRPSVGEGLILFVFVSSTGLIVANSIAGALADFPESAGTVSALIGAIHYGSGIAGSGLVGTFADGTPWPMAWVILICGNLCLLSMGLLKNQFQRSDCRESEGAEI